MKASYSDEQKQQVLTHLANGLSVKETAEKSGVKPQTISNWKAEHKRANGGRAEPRKRSKKTRQPERSVEQQLVDTEFKVTLHALEIRSLRKIANVTDPSARLTIEIEYLLERCTMLGDNLVKRLLEVPAEPETR